MPKGFYTQGFVILLREAITLDQVASALTGVPILKRVAATECPWAIAGPSLVVGHRPEVNGLVSVDIVNHTWPDHMGDPKNEPEIFAAWAMGHFGPFAYPEGLTRAIQQSWSWGAASQVASQHKAFLRIRSSYGFGAPSDAKVIPSDYRPLPELLFLSDLASSLLGMAEALCYFNPNGERLLPATRVQELIARGKGAGPVPLELWSNIRMFNLGHSPAWTLMDTVGMGQLDAPDHEACFQTDAYSCQEVDNFLFNAAFYVFEHGRVIEDGNTMDGPGGVRWQARTIENGMTAPPREVIRWLPMDDHARPQGL